MRRLNAVLTLAAVLLAPALSLEALAQSKPVPPAACPPSATLDQLPQALDEAMSGPGDKDRSCLRQMLLPDARLYLMVRVADNQLAPHALTMDEWISAVHERGSAPFLVKQIKVTNESFGHIAQLWSTYEMRSDPGAAPSSRGVYGLQAIFDGSSWRIAEILWQPERPDAPIPARYLP